MIIYRPIATPESGQILGRAYLNQLRDNRAYFLGILDRRAACPEAVWRGWIGTETSLNVWTGYHLLRSDATLLHYYFDVVSTDGSEPNTVKLYYDNTLIAEAKDATGAGKSASGTYSLAAKAAGLYEVRYEFQRTDGNYAGECFCSSPWTSFTAASGYTAGSVSDGGTIAVSDFTKLQGNDAHFYNQLPPTPGFVRHYLGFIASGKETYLQAAYVQRYGGRIYYKIEMLLDAYPDPSSCRVVIYWNGVAVKTLSNTQQDQVHEGYVDVSGSNGSWYKLQVYLRRNNDTNGCYAEVYYLQTAPASATTWSAISDYSVGQYVYGSTAGQTTAVTRLFTQDAALASYLYRKDFATRFPEWIELGKAWEWDVGFKHIYDFLWYRGDGLRLVYGDGQSASLPDCEDEEYKVLDLNSVSKLHVGMQYAIEGMPYFAMEAPYAA